LAESGLSGFHFESWFGLLAPAATPVAIQEKINAAVNKIIGNKDVKERLLALGMDSPQWSLDAFNKVFLADRDLMTKIVKETGITRES
jgi:tripartite-type tricarboxylate transporter receptor subunit TctC